MSTNSSNSDYIPFNESPTSTNFNNRGRNNRGNNFRRGFSHPSGPRNIGDQRHPFSPYNRGGGKHFNNSPRFDHAKPKDISAYYHPSMLENPWARLEQQLLEKRASKLENDPDE